MPTYVFQCNKCGQREDRILKLREFNTPQFCPSRTCNYTMRRVVTAPMIATDYPGYDCPVTGKWIEGRRQHEENLKRTDSRLLEPGETREKEKARAAADAALDKAIDTTVEREVAAMPSAKREQLFKEVAAGADITVTRK